MRVAAPHATPVQGGEHFLIAVHGIRQRLWLERVAQAAWRGVWIGAFLLIVSELVERALPVAPAPTLALASIPIGALAVGLAYVLLRRPTALEAARATDRRLRLREQLGTAVEMIRGGHQAPIARAPDGCVRPESRRSVGIRGR